MTAGHELAARTEQELAARVIDTLLREDYADLSQRVRLLRQGNPALQLPAGHGGAGLVLPLERDGFLADLRVRRAACPRLTLDDVDSALAAVSDPRDSAGVASFADECRQALATLRLRERCLPGIRAGLARRWHAGPGTWCGPSGMLAYEALAATMPHPVYPTAECRHGLSEDDSLRYVPEYLPEFGLRWVAVPRSRLTMAGRHDCRPPWWPLMPEVGLPESLAATHDLVPVHPLTARHQLARALDEAGLTGAGAEGPAGPADQAMIAPGTCLPVTPTLSTRTVAVVGQPRSHIKLPLPMSTLGRLNRRFIQPGTLADGALVRNVLATAARDDQMLGGLLLADEGTYAHAGHPYLAYLLRRLRPAWTTAGSSRSARCSRRPWAPPRRAAVRWSSRSSPAGRRPGTCPGCLARISSCCLTRMSGCSPGTASPWRPTSRTPRWCSASSAGPPVRRRQPACS